MGLNKTSYYKWLNNNPVFVEELKRQQHLLSAEALSRLEKNIGKAVDVLVALLKSKNETVRRYAANDILNHFLKVQEFVDLEERLQRLEQLILKNQRMT